MKKPEWLDKKINLTDCRRLKKLLRNSKLSTVCEEARCPNVSECFKNKVATFMILGNICTRHCAFCATAKGKPLKIDYGEPHRVREAAKVLGLKYIVITSPTRDDLKDGGSCVFCKTVEELKKIRNIKVELLIPDFKADAGALNAVASCGADVLAHNLETVPSLYIKVRQGADYSRSLEVLSFIKRKNPKIHTKSGLMLGLGETTEELLGVLKDLRQANCDFLTLGQYLAPSKGHYPVKEYVDLKKFEYIRDEALRYGFLKVKSSPYIRSSYLAETFLK